MSTLLELVKMYMQIMTNACFAHFYIISEQDNKTDIIDRFRGYFNNFSQINLEELKMYLDKTNLKDTCIDNLFDYISYLKMLNEKYNISNLDDLAAIILNEWDKEHVYSDELIKLILLISNDNEPLINHSNLLIKIYLDMVEENMIKNPNISVGTSSEKLYTMLPQLDICYDANLKILANPNIEWDSLRNGMNPFACICYDLNEAQTEEEKAYYINAIKTAISNSCSLFNNRYEKNKNGYYKTYTINYYFMAGLKPHDNLGLNLVDKQVINELFEFLLSDEIFEHQINLYTEPNEEADKILKELNSIKSNIKRQILN